MSGPQTIHDYLAAFNAALEVGLRSRRRILEELCDHLCQAAGEHLRRGETEQEAQRRAIATFGSPAEVAAGFERGLIGSLDRRLAVTAGRLDVWMARHPKGGAVIRAALFVPPAALLAGLGLAFGAPDVGYSVAMYLFAFGAMWSFILGGLARKLRGRPEAGLRARLAAHHPMDAGLDAGYPLGGFSAVAVWGTYLGVLAKDTGLNGLLVMAMVILSVSANLLFPRALARNCAGEDATSQWISFRSEHPWWGALVHCTYLPVSALALALAFPAPLGFKLALLLVILGMTVGLAALRFVAWNAHEKEWIEQELGDSA